MKIKKILVSLPQPDSDKSPYSELISKYNLKIDFKPFIQVQGYTISEFRRTKVNILDHQSVILTNKTAVDHLFRICNEMRIMLPEAMKYFCLTNQIAFYLQKYITYRKRKIFYTENNQVDELVEMLNKYKNEHFLLPLSEVHKQEIPRKLDKKKLKFTKAPLYRTICLDIKSEIGELNYDVLVFFSPSDIESLLKNYPDFIQNDIKIATFGTSTARAIKKYKLRLDIKAPTPEAPSMTMALEQFIKANGNCIKK